MQSIRRALTLVLVCTVAVGAAAPATAAMMQSNIVQTATAAGQFKTLLKLAERAGLVGALEAKGPLTVFAPTDAAFSKLPRAAVVALEHHRSKLRAVLLYHVLRGSFTAARLVKLHSVKTLNGQSLPVRVRNGIVTIGGARVLRANITASNGIIHVINGVLIPR